MRRMSEAFENQRLMTAASNDCDSLETGKQLQIPISTIEEPANRSLDSYFFLETCWELDV